MAQITHETSGATQSLRWRAFDLARNIALLACLYLAYAAVRRVTADQFTDAFRNARALLDFQAAIGLPSEQVLQSAVIYHPGLVRAANTFYMSAHFPGTALFLAWAWFRHHQHFSVIRSSLITLTSAGLLLHLLFPLAPPRMLRSQGFIDTGAVFGPSPYDLSAAEAANQIAAMPSLHVGWALLVAISVISLSRSRFRWLIVIHPILTTAVVVMTANHYWADVIIASFLVISSWMLAVRLRNRRRPESHHPERLEAEPPPPPLGPAQEQIEAELV